MRVDALESQIQKGITDLLDAERIPYWRMNAGDRFGSYTSKRTGKTKNWRIKGHATGTPDLLVSFKSVNQSVPGFLWIEVKKPGEVQEPEQIEFQRRATVDWGHDYIVATSIDDVLHFLEVNQ